MKKNLIIVESPAKIKTLKKFLGSNYIFESSVGHIRDLPPKKFGIDMENNFEAEYEIMEGKKKVITNLKKAAKASEIVYLAPDPDREGKRSPGIFQKYFQKEQSFSVLLLMKLPKRRLKMLLLAPEKSMKS